MLARLPRLKLRGVRGSALAFVTDEVLHLIGKVQPLLIGLNLPDEVESSRHLRVHACSKVVLHHLGGYYTSWEVV